MNIGDLLELTDEQKIFVKNENKKIKAIHNEILRLSETIQERGELAWNMIYEINPESINFNLQIIPETGDVIIIGKKYN